MITGRVRVGVAVVATKVKGTVSVLECCRAILGAWNGSVLAAYIFRDTVGATGSSGCALGVVHQGANYLLSIVLWVHKKGGNDTHELHTDTL